MTTGTQLRIPLTEQDDPTFIDLVSCVLNAIVECHDPGEVYVIQLDNWFGHKWKGFPAGRASLVRVRWFESLLVPPFHPSRVRKQVHFRRDDAGEPRYREEDVPCLHLSYQGNPEVRHRPLRRVASSAVCLWYSSRTALVDRGSLMVYRVEGDEELAWHASFLKQGPWKLERTEGISPQEVLKLASLS